MKTTRRQALTALGIATAAVALPFGANAKDPIAWPSGLDWMSWSDAADQASKSGKIRMLVVYADWCGVCRKVAPWFGDKDLQAAAAPLLVVRQNKDEAPEWMEKYAATGNSVPRVLFIKPDGSLDTSITSDRSDYPYFYGTPELLLKSIRVAAKGSGSSVGRFGCSGR